MSHKFDRSAVELCERQRFELVNLVDEWGIVAYVRPITTQDFESIQPFVGKAEGNVRLVQKTLCDECGNLLFAEDDLEWLALRSIKSTLKIVEIALRVSGLADEKKV